MAKEKSPTFKQDKLKAGVPVELTLKKGVATATGTSQHGLWELWVVDVTDGTVVDRATNAVLDNYNGEAVCFPSEGMLDAFNEITGGTKEGCRISICKEFKENDEGKPYTVYNVTEVGAPVAPVAAPAVAAPVAPVAAPVAPALTPEQAAALGVAPVVSQGQTPPSALSELQLTFIKDFKGFVDRKIVNESKEVFDKFGKTAPYTFDDATLNTLWAVYQE